ncbi:MAG: hypothetical protein ACEQSK_06475 [Sphingomonadaceae bacterium]
MTLQTKDILHKGLQRFWSSAGQDKRGISASWAQHAAAILVHLYKAHSLDDLLGGYGRHRKIKRLTGHVRRYSIELNANWRITFDCLDPDTGAVTNVDIEDLHRSGGAQRR